MKEKPILFNGKMVRAILDGRKTQTRRPISPQPKIIHAMCSDGSLVTERIFRSGDQRIHPPYSVGDRLYVREAWCMAHHYCDNTGDTWGEYLYRATAEDANEKWRPSIHMPKSAARIWLEVTDVAVQPLSFITEDDARKEGFNSRAEFVATWILIYGEESYMNNLQVWVIDFKRIQRPQ